MFEKVNKYHPDKIADRIAGAIVDLAYKKNINPKVAAEVLIGHGKCHIINETSEHFTEEEIASIVERIAGKMDIDYQEYRQDMRLAENQREKIRCGDNGIFKGTPETIEENALGRLSRKLAERFPSDGKCVIDQRDQRLIICQSNATEREIIDFIIHEIWKDIPELKQYRPEINPLGYWTGGTDTDSGATNRKLGSDMGKAATGGGLHGKDLSKADVSLNIYAHIEADHILDDIECCCAIGDEEIEGIPYQYITERAMEYITERGGFEKFAEWGFI